MKFFATIATLMIAIFLAPATSLRGKGFNRTGFNRTVLNRTVLGNLLHNRTKNLTDCVNRTGLLLNRTGTGKNRTIIGKNRTIIGKNRTTIGKNRTKIVGSGWWL